MTKQFSFKLSKARVSPALLSFVLLACEARPVSLDTEQPPTQGQQSNSPTPIPSNGSNGQTGQNGSAGDGNGTQLKAPTFYQDVLPIMKKSTPGQNYKCSVCHPNYMDPKIVSVPATASGIITSIESGRMPLNGDPVSAADLEILKTWRRSGMQIGTPP